MGNNLTPSIRFNGFTDAWEQRKLGDVTKKIGSGKTPKGGNSTYLDVGIPLIRSQNIFGNRLDFTDIAYISKDTDNEMKNSRVNENDVLLNITGASIGRSAVYREKFTANVNQHVCIIRPEKHYSSNFIQLNLSSYKGQKEVELNQAGGGREGLNFKQISKMSFYYPNYNEQTKIGNFFKQLDDTIALHQRELDLLKEQKKGFLQKMFPKKDEMIPEIRFEGFTDAWEQRKLGDIFNIMDGDRGKNYPSENEFFNIGATLFLDTGNVKKDGFDFSNTKYITSEKDSLLRSGKLELYDFVLTSRGTLGNVAYYDEKTLSEQPSVRINSAMLILRPLLRKQVSDNYMASVLRGNIIDTFMSRNHVGSAQPHITKRDFSKVAIGIPKTIEEQTQIGNFFKQLDDTIALHQRKVELLKELKKGYLQNMFV